MTTHTSTYSILEISAEAFDSVKASLIKALDNNPNEISEYVHNEGTDELMVFGTVALKRRVMDSPRLSKDRIKCGS